MRAVLVLMLLSRTVVAQPIPTEVVVPPEEHARLAAAEAMQLSAGGNYLQAAAKLDEAFAFDPQPSYLFDSAQSYRLGNDCAKAGEQYRNYLEVSPNASNRGEAQQFLRDVDVCVAFNEGRRLMGAGKPREACEAFTQAYDKDPTAVGTMLNLGLCNQQLGKLATALDWFRRGRRLAVESKLPSSEAEATQRIETLQAQVPKIELTLPTARDVEITIDGRRVSAGVHEVDPGTHVVEATNAARPFAQTVTVDAGQQASIVIPTEEPRSRVPAYVLGGAGLALFTGAAVLGIVGKAAYDDASTLEEQDEWRTRVRYGGTGMFAAGCLATGAAVYLYVRAGKRALHETIITPTAGAGHVGLVVGGHF